MTVADRLAAVEERISQAARRVGRAPDLVRLVAVSKTFPAAVLAEAVAAGQRRLGENRVQEAQAKAEELAGAVEWHLVGHLQGNKAAKAAQLFDWIHSVDSVALGERLSKALERTGRSIDVLVQVNLSGEESKEGVAPADLFTLLELVGPLTRLRLRGLMTLPPPAPTAEAARPWFRQLATLAKEAAEGGLLPQAYDLSMGMSGDFEVAVEEGATLVRVGSAVFGPRDVKG